MVSKIISSGLFKRYAIRLLSISAIIYIAVFLIGISQIYSYYINSLNEAGEELVVDIEKEVREKGMIHRLASIKSILEQSRFYNKNIINIDIYSATNPKILFSTKQYLDVKNVPQLLIDYVHEDVDNKILKKNDSYLLLRRVCNPIDDVIGVLFIEYDNSKFLEKKHKFAALLAVKILGLFVVSLVILYGTLCYILLFRRKNIDNEERKAKGVAFSKAQLFRLKKFMNGVFLLCFICVEGYIVLLSYKDLKRIEFDAFVETVSASSLIIKSKTEKLVKYVDDISYISGGGEILEKYLDNYKFVRYAIITDINGMIISDMGDVDGAFVEDENNKTRLRDGYKNIAVAIRNNNSDIVGWLQIGAAYDF